MSDLELLFLVLVGLYGWECACWLRRGSVGLRTWIGHRWRLLHPATLLGNQHGGFVFAPPLPPLGAIIGGNQLPGSLSPEAVLAYVSININPGWRPPQSGKLIRWDQIKTIKAAGKKVLIDGALFWKTATPTFAAYLAEQLSQLRKATPVGRQKMIEQMFRESFDSAAIKARWQEFRKRTRTIRWLTNALFFHLFLLIPTVIWNWGLRTSWMGLLIGLLALTASIAILFRRVHTFFYPRADDERFTHSLIVLLSPVTAIRAQDILSRPLLETFHPLALTQVFCPPDQFQKFAKRVLRETRFPALPLSPAGAEAERTEQSSRALIGTILEAFLRENGVNPDDLSGGPVRADSTCRTYCPRCESQFTTAEGACQDCGGIALVPFAAR